MSSVLRIDQAGLSGGVPGVSRTDGLSGGELVTVTNTGAGTITVFELLWTPPGDDTAAASLAATGDPKVWTFSPKAGVYGTYLVALLVDGNERERRTLVVRTPSGLVIPALNERGNRNASLAEPGDASLVDNNAVDSPDPNLAALPFAAWWRSMHEIAMALDGAVAPVRVTHAFENAGGVVTHTGYRTIGEALAVAYPSSFSNVAIYDIEPTVIAPIDEGPYTLDSVVRYCFRAARGRGSDVILPAFEAPTDVNVECCSVRAITGGGGIRLYDCTGGSTIEADYLEMQRCLLSITTATVAGGMRARDTDFDEPVAFEVLGGGSFERCSFSSTLSYETANTDVQFDDCRFGGTPSVTFTADPGVVRMDARSKFLFDAAGGGVTNGSVTVEAPP